MRPFLIGGVALGLLGLSVGCDRWTRSDDRHVDNRAWSGTPKAEELVRSLNANAARVKSLECADLVLDGKGDGQSFGADGSLACQKGAAPGVAPNFRMDATVLGHREVDIGSNGQEFWYWIGRAPEPYVFHCAYTDFRAGKARMPFPFQPEWIVEALNIAEYDPTKTYEVREGPAKSNTVELIEATRSPQGEPVYKVTVFNRGGGRDRGPQVAARELRDAKGARICVAQNLEMQRDGLTGAEIPRVVRLNWPQQKMELKLTMNKVKVNGALDGALFTRNNLRNIAGYDLARGPDAPANGIQRAGGVGR